MNKSTIKRNFPLSIAIENIYVHWHCSVGNLAVFVFVSIFLSFEESLMILNVCLEEDIEIR